jgi:hypothetical protein
MAARTVSDERKCRTLTLDGRRLPVARSWHESAVPEGGTKPDIDVTVAHPARVYDYWLGGYFS